MTRQRHKRLDLVSLVSVTPLRETAESSRTHQTSWRHQSYHPAVRTRQTFGHTTLASSYGTS